LLSGKQWSERVENGVLPFICMAGGNFCRAFETKRKLEDHLAKKPDHVVDVKVLQARGLMVEEQIRR